MNLPGDTFTVEGVYARRTLREWLIRKPKRLRVFTVTGEITAAARAKAELKLLADALPSVTRINGPA